MEVDVAIVGGGPAGATVGTLLRKYDPSLRVAIFERERFPRDHIGESQLPAITGILHEMEVWDKVEAAGFPIKVGSTYRWGKTPELWHLNFLEEELAKEARPAKFAGQRTRTSFQVDRGVYDQILLEHSREMGCEVYEEARATSVRTDGDRIAEIEIGGVGTVRAERFVDATGASGLIRRALGIEVASPTSLRNVALWDYWQDAEWAETVGAGGTRVQIMSLGWGWVWFIPISATRTSIGLVTPAERLKSSGAKPEDLYLKAISEEPRISELVTKAKREQRFSTTKDWSYLAERLCGENWFLAGDACGFADPILSAGMTLAHVGARKVAYSLLEARRGDAHAEWVKREFDRSHRANVGQHIRFADYWYSANGCFGDLKEYCSEIARDAGIELDPDSAFLWLSNGGFTAGNVPEDRATTFGLMTMKGIIGRFSGRRSSWMIGVKNRFKLNLAGATRDVIANYAIGRVEGVHCYRRGEKILPLIGGNLVMFNEVNRESDATRLAQNLLRYFGSDPRLFPNPRVAYALALEALEAFIADGWVTASVDRKRPFIEVRD